MNYIGKFISNFKDFYNEINAATLTGAIDVVVVRQEDGSYLSSPFHVRFGKMGVLRSREKVVDIEINGEPVDIHMKLGESGEAFFVQELEDSEEISPLLGTSPLPPSFLQEKLDLARAEEEESRPRDSGVDESISSSVGQSVVPPGDVTVTDSPETETAGDQDSTLSPLTDTGDDVKIVRVKLSEDPKSEIGIVRIIRKTDAKVERRDHGTQTINNNNLTTSNKKVEVNNQGKGPNSKSQVGDGAVQKRNSLIIDGQGSKTDGEETVRMNKSIRRKRKKRCNGKKSRPKSTGSQSSDTSTTSEVADINAVLPSGGSPGNQDGIFVMDDIENNEKSGPSTSTPTSHMAQSSSMPLLREKSREEVVDEWSGSMSRSMGPDFHPFSDTDLSPPPSPSSSRPPTPIKSDTEYEVERQRTDFIDGSSQTDENKWSWTWGELPTPPPKTPTRTSSSAADSSEMKNESDMKKTSKGEVSAVKDDDVESGNGPSLPQSPHSVEGAIGGPKLCSDSDFEDYRHPIFDYKGYHDIAFSLCGRLHEYEGDFPESLFMQSLVTYDDFCENPQILENPDLVVRFGGKYLNWRTVSPQILSLVLFQRPVPQKLSEALYKEHMTKKEIRKRSESKGYSWFSWRRTNPEDADAPQNKIEDSSVKKEVSDSFESSEKSVTEEILNPGDPNLVEVTAAETQTTPPGTPKKKGLHGHTPGTDSSESEDLEDRKDRRPSGDRYKKSLRLTSEQIEKLNLREGSNEALFSVTTAYQGTTRCKCHIFLWNHDDKIVVSDIDGTITKSDVLGHLLPILGKDWAQSGVAQLFTKIKNNGYHFLYLSARAIGQARITRDYLRSIKQGDLSLPDGPLLLNPTSLVQAFHREVIEKKPEEFKISCLRDIQALYPPGRNPFYSGYGNKINDVWAYRAVGIPISRIFTINHRGELKHELTQTFQSSYSNLSDISNHMFPPVAHQETLGEYSSLQYWRAPLPDVSTEIEAVLSEERGK
ncbi:phosphatidate phosphatase LPIN3 isoform X4 [Penaeus vannamei]|uniref:phosphatidate phosphatase LPIN3 isoform X4 n=1 Tax=Penaeus vannamei TaxID=6689 RepID=UPI00387F5689